MTKSTVLATLLALSTSLAFANPPVHSRSYSSKPQRETHSEAEHHPQHGGGWEVGAGASLREPRARDMAPMQQMQPMMEMQPMVEMQSMPTMQRIPRFQRHHRTDIMLFAKEFPDYFDASRPRNFDGLPPGLQKRLAHSKGLPHGWQKKLIRGKQLPTDVWIYAQPIPAYVLPDIYLPPNTILYGLNGKALLLATKGLVLLDSFDVM